MDKQHGCPHNICNRSMTLVICIRHGAFKLGLMSTVFWSSFDTFHTAATVKERHMQLGKLEINVIVTDK